MLYIFLKSIIKQHIIEAKSELDLFIYVLEFYSKVANLIRLRE